MPGPVRTLAGLVMVSIGAGVSVGAGPSVGEGAWVGVAVGWGVDVGGDCVVVGMRTSCVASGVALAAGARAGLRTMLNSAKASSTIPAAASAPMPMSDNQGKRGGEGRVVIGWRYPCGVI